MIHKVLPDEMSLLTREPAFAFFKESGIAGELNFEHFCETWAKWIALDMAAIFVYVDGNETVAIIGGLCIPCSMTADLIAQETFWWAHPRLRGRSPTPLRLLMGWEAWALAKGSSRIYLGHLNDLNSATMASIYQRRGYKPTEIHYTKEYARNESSS